VSIYAGTNGYPRGPVVDVEFPVGLDARDQQRLETDLELGGETKTLTLEVAQHIGDGRSRWEIHREPPRSTTSSRRPRCSRPASRSSTCSRRTSKGGKIGLFGGAGVGKTVSSRS
jgi:F0F1-type ATP synthase beta subunit